MVAKNNPCILVRKFQQPIWPIQYAGMHGGGGGVKIPKYESSHVVTMYEV
jgi:hypothetical protein